MPSKTHQMGVIIVYINEPAVQPNGHLVYWNRGSPRCLLSARQLHFLPKVAGKIIIGCCVLYNMCLRADLVIEPLRDEEEQSEASREPLTASASTSVSPVLRKGHSAKENLIAQLERVTWLQTLLEPWNMYSYILYEYLLYLIFYIII